MNRLLLGAALALWLGAAAAADSPITADQRRSAEQTFLTYPEWFLVHSPAEYADLVEAAPPHRFPFLGHVKQLWSSYFAVIGEQMRAHYPANPGYHFMILVIATSTTVEYAVRALYENTFGRITWALSSGLTAEDRYAARAARDYVDFIRKDPWYLFDFRACLAGMWRDTPAFGDNLLRKWERRYALTTEYLVKAGYAWLIRQGTETVYDPALLTTQVVVDRVPSPLPGNIRLVRELPGGAAVLELPRYFAFRLAATELARRGVVLEEIAGNRGDILVTVWTPVAVEAADLGGRRLFEQALLTRPGTKRIGLVLPVRALSAFLLAAPGKGLSVEHVYDY